MSRRSYRGNRGKNIYEIDNFSKGINNTNSSINNGNVKELINFKISPDGTSLRPREPYINYTFFTKDEEDNIKFINLSNELGVFISKQFPSKEFIVDFKGHRPDKEIVINDPENIRVIDGDTIEYKEVVYRLLIIDTPEKDEPGFDEATQFTQLFIDNSGTITLKYDPQTPSWVDAFDRQLVWVYNENGEILNKDLLMGGYAELLDENISEHKYGDLHNWGPRGPNIFEYVGFIPTVYVRDLNQKPVLIKTVDNKFEVFNGIPKENKYRPAYELKYFHNIYMGPLLNDISEGYTLVPEIKSNKINTQTFHFDTIYNPVSNNELPNYDGIVMLGNVNIDLKKKIETLEIDLFQNIRYTSLNTFLQDIYEFELKLTQDIYYTQPDISIQPFYEFEVTVSQGISYTDITSTLQDTYRFNVDMFQNISYKDLTSRVQEVYEFEILGTQAVKYKDIISSIQETYEIDVDLSQGIVYSNTSASIQETYLFNVDLEQDIKYTDIISGIQETYLFNVDLEQDIVLSNITTDISTIIKTEPTTPASASTLNQIYTGADGYSSWIGRSRTEREYTWQSDGGITYDTSRRTVTSGDACYYEGEKARGFLPGVNNEYESFTCTFARNRTVYYWELIE